MGGASSKKNPESSENIMEKKVAAETEQHKSGPLCGLSRR
jgi:hypothetical protein